MKRTPTDTATIGAQHHRGIVTLALIAAFMVFVDGTIVNLTLTQLGSHLHASRSELQWAIDAYTLSFAAVMLGAGAITDALSAKRAFVTGLLVFTAFSGLCSLAGSMLVLDLARLAQGAGAALLLPSALVLATSSASDEQSRHRLVGWWAAAGGVGMAAGPLLGGVLVAVIDWRAVFAVNVIVGVPAIVWTVQVMPPVASRARRLDLAGMTTATALIGGLVFALIQGPAQGWTNPAVLAAIGLAVAGTIGFIIAERSVKAPLLPVGVYSDRTFIATAIQGGLFNFTFYGLLFAMSLMLQQGRGLSALIAGLLFLPLTALISVGNLRASSLTQRLGRPKLIGISQAVLTVTLLAVAWAASAAPLWPLMIALLPAGFFSGLLVPAMTSQAINAVEPALHGAASAAFNTSRQVGGAIGIAIFGPLLGTSHNLKAGFITCVLVTAAATGLTSLLTVTVHALDRRFSHGVAANQTDHDASPARCPTRPACQH